ncbi:oxdD [Scenedesmus sp. PABB004]|nr:oxdD [Scenedesmus sp. PABB004]
MARRAGLHLVLIVAASAIAAVAGDEFIERFSQVPWQEFAGGRFKASTAATLTATTMAGAVFELKPGGLRELHWHDAAEWAMVLDGTCMAVATDEGVTHASDAWNFTFGDVWYFPRNVPHAVLGAGRRGCTYVTAYNSPTLNELEAFGASAWLATVPVDALAQGLGLSAASAQQVLDANPGKAANFIGLGDLGELLREAPALPQRQWPQLIHRFPLLQNTPEVVNADGSTVNMVDVTRFPVSSDMSGALVRIAAGGMRQLHWHLGINEWQYVLNGTFEVGVFTAVGASASGVLRPGDLGFAPRGSGHYLRNVGPTPGAVVLIFDAGRFSNVDVGNFLGASPPSWTAASLNISGQLARRINYALPGFAPRQGPPPSGARVAAAAA